MYDIIHLLNRVNDKEVKVTEAAAWLYEAIKSAGQAAPLTIPLKKERLIYKKLTLHTKNQS